MIKGMVTWDVMVIQQSRRPILIGWLRKDSGGQIFMLRQMFARLQEHRLLTGRYGIRNGMYSASGTRRVLFPDSKGGLPTTEITHG